MAKTIAEALAERKRQKLPDEQVKEIVDERIQQLRDGLKGDPGDSGFTPKKGVHYFDGIDGKDAPPTDPKEIALKLSDEESFLKKVKGKQGKQGVPGYNGKDGRDGKDGKDGKGIDEVTPEEVKTLLEKLPIKEAWFDVAHIKNLPKSIPLTSKHRLGRGTGSPVDIYDIYSLLDGVTKVFNIPSNSRVILIISSSEPFFFRPTVDYTVAGTVLTFTSNVDAASMLAAGQSIGVQYVGS